MTAHKVAEYLGKIGGKFATGEAGEHSYRAPFEEFLGTTCENCQIINEPKRSQFGAPDFIVKKGAVPLAYIETKDLAVNLDKVQTSEQLERYLGYPKLILTNYIEFRFFRDGEPYGEKIIIASRHGEGLVFHAEAYELLVRELSAFLELGAQTITSAEKLSRIMGGRGRRLRENIVIYSKEGGEKSRSLLEQFDVFKRLLIHDLTIEQFADMYAQTLVYGLFVARFYDKTPGNFSRQEAQGLVPRSNPFLRQFFNHISGPEFDSRLDYIVSDLSLIFTAADVKGIMEDRFRQVGLWGKDPEALDPVVHFYEDFLGEYDKGQKLDRGVFYTRPPIVRFIVRSVDEILRRDFGLSKGLADTSKVEHEISIQETNKTGQFKKVKEQIHRVQILDPAVGTGTFLNETIHKIYESFESQKGQWPSYVNEHLLPRMHGFELLVASYIVAHLKLSMVLTETGAEPNDRIGVYLTNSLEPAGAVQPQLEFGLMRSLTEESIGASRVKEELPVMVVIGNPPYKGESQNKQYTGHDVYKVEPGGRMKLQERNSKWLNDDYVKFIRLAESFIEKTGTGIVAMITAHGYIDNPTFRGMRWHLTKTFDSIYVLDLHGNLKKEELSPDGNKDENVFDIQQGVAILIAVKTGDKKANQPARVYHDDLFGSRRSKFTALDSYKPNWQEVSLDDQMYFFVDKNMEGREEYRRGFSLDELFLESSVGIATFRDELAIDQRKEMLQQRVLDFKSLDVVALRQKYGIPKDTSSWQLPNAKNDVERNFSESHLRQISYRPFDVRWIYYTHENKGFIARPRYAIMKHLLERDNIALLVPRQLAVNEFNHAFIGRGLIDMCLLTNRTKEAGYVFPLYLYSDDNTRTSNLRKEIVSKIENVVGAISSEDILDYIYATLYSLNYRKKYQEFLKTDFPRIPYPSNKETFLKLVQKGRDLRLYHLLEHPEIGNYTSKFPALGSNIVGPKFPIFRKGEVFINETQSFQNISEEAFGYVMGSYLPAQKWLKDRRGMKLSFDDISHYQKIIVALTETDRIMEEIDKIK